MWFLKWNLRNKLMLKIFFSFISGVRAWRFRTEKVTSKRVPLLYLLLYDFGAIFNHIEIQRMQIVPPHFIPKNQQFSNLHFYRNQFRINFESLIVH